LDIEFEQTKRELSGRSILITSWFDGHDWRASAPGYSHLAALGQSDARSACGTRKAAIDQIVSLLAKQLAITQTPSTERVLFL
jgi:hypothetical protein